jgi:hypothetical protein
MRVLPITVTEVDPDSGSDMPPSPPDQERTLDLEKGWHGLHFLLTGTSDEGEEPACFLVRGGDDLDDEGQTRALMPQQVRQFAEYLAMLTPNELTRRYDPTRMTKLEIYPLANWARPARNGESHLEWLIGCFTELRDFLGRAAAANDGVVIHIG